MSTDIVIGVSIVSILAGFSGGLFLAAWIFEREVRNAMLRNR